MFIRGILISILILAGMGAPLTAHALNPGAGGASGDMNGAVIAQGMGGFLTLGSAEAYVDALTFVHAEAGSPVSFDAGTRQLLIVGLAQAYPTLSVQIQAELAVMPQILEAYLASWPMLDLSQKQSFAFTVLSLAYGDDAAAQAVGYPQGGAGNGGGGGLGAMAGPDVCYGGTCETMGDTTILYPDD